MTQKDNILTPDEGMWLTNDKWTYSQLVYLGKYDDASNWREVNNDEYEAAVAELDAAAEDMAMQEPQTEEA